MFKNTTENTAYILNSWCELEAQGVPLAAAVVAIDSCQVRWPTYAVIG